MSYAVSGARYLANDVLSRPKEWLVPLLFEHLLANLSRARACMETGELEGKVERLAKANQIVLELAASLDREKGGEIAEHLAMLYTFFATTIVDVGRGGDVALLGRLITMVGELHEAWVAAAEQVAPRARAAAPVARQAVAV